MAIDQSVPNASIDTIAVFNGFTQVFQNARPLRDEVMPRAKLMDHPLETGQIVSDYKITFPVEISIIFIIPIAYYRDTYQEMWGLWQQSTILTIQTRVASYGNMIISEQPHEETPEIFDAVKLMLKFRQVLIPAQTQTFQPADPTQDNIQAIGQQTATSTVLPATPPASTEQAVHAQFGASGSW